MSLVGGVTASRGALLARQTADDHPKTRQEMYQDLWSITHETLHKTIAACRGSPMKLLVGFRSWQHAADDLSQLRAREPGILLVENISQQYHLRDAKC